MKALINAIKQLQFAKHHQLKYAYLQWTLICNNNKKTVTTLSIFQVNTENRFPIHSRNGSHNSVCLIIKQK
uniref:Uncharacterized protein n=1 Tax=Anguilla anguilla TaxID=7936 RepID=A0A0E9W6P3_ANGAN